LKLSEGGNVTMPLQDTFWGAYFGMWTDKFGINWMVNYDDPDKTQQHYVLIFCKFDMN
jgi:PhnB protein